MTFTLFLLCLSVTGVLRAQELSSRNEALKQICNQYDCAGRGVNNQEQSAWPCSPEYSKYLFSVVLTASAAAEKPPIPARIHTGVVVARPQQPHRRVHRPRRIASLRRRREERVPAVVARRNFNLVDRARDLLDRGLAGSGRAHGVEWHSASTPSSVDTSWAPAIGAATTFPDSTIPTRMC